MFIRNAFWLFTFTLFVLFVFLPSYSQMQDLRQKNVDYQRQIRFLVKRNAQLAEEDKRLRTDPVYLEKVAREKMGLIKEGEVVYKISAPPAEEE